MNLETNYMGLKLRNPVVASAGPLSQTVDGIRELGDGGVGAVVVYSLFEEQLRREAERVTAEAEEYDDMFGEATSFFPSMVVEEFDPSRKYLELIEGAAKASEVPVIASLNGSSVGAWTQTAKRLEDAGASALELNIYLVPGDLTATGAQVEERHLEIVAAVKETLSIPVAVKLSPYFSSVGNMCVRLDEAGADGLVLFNRFLQPDIDIERMEVTSGISLSQPGEAKLPRTWIAILRDKVKASLAATTGVEAAEDVVKYILAGADVVMTTSALVRHGAGYAGSLVAGLESWLDAHSLTLEQARGMMAVPADVDASQYERAGYVSALEQVKSTYGSLA